MIKRWRDCSLKIGAYTWWFVLIAAYANYATGMPYEQWRGVGESLAVVTVFGSMLLAAGIVITQELTKRYGAQVRQALRV